MDIADLQDRYGARTSAELAAQIECGEVYDHPAWEELIEWQNLEAYLERMSRAYHARAGRQPLCSFSENFWIPACAGVTSCRKSMGKLL